MKHLKLIIVALVGFSFLGMDQQSKNIMQSDLAKRPTLDQKVKITTSKLEVANSKVEIGIAELKNIE